MAWRNILGNGLNKVGAMRGCGVMRRAILVSVTLWASLALLAGGVGVVAQGDEGGGELPHIYLIWQEIEILNQCNEIGLTSEQAARAAAAIEPACEKMQSLREQESSAAVRAALGQVREALVRGGPVPEAVWIELARARGTLGQEDDDDDALERRKAEAADEIGKALLGVLTEQQISRLGGSPVQNVAREIAHNLGEARAQPPAEWEGFKSEALAAISEAFEDMGLELEAVMREKLEAFFDRVRKMDTDTYFQQRDRLSEEFASLVGSGQQEGPEAVRMRALNRLAEWAAAPGLLQLLKDMAAANRAIMVND